MATIRKTKNGSYQARVCAGVDNNGKKLFKYITKSGLQEIKKAVRKIEEEIENQDFSSMENINAYKWFSEWIELNKNRISPNTLQSYNIYVNHHFKPYFENLKLGKISSVHIKKYTNDKLETLSVTTVRKHLFVLRKMLREALGNKTPNIELPAPKQHKPHIVTKKEFEILHSAVKGKKQELIILLSAWCGLRRGEIFALKWNDFDKDNRTIRVDESLSISKNEYVEKHTKSNNGMRTIVLPDELLNMLEQKRVSQKVIHQRIFDGRPDTFTSWFRSFVKKLNLEIRFHDLRHYHATWLYINGIPDIYAAQRLGHDINTLKRIYQHIDADKQKDIDNKIIELLNIENK